MLLTIFFFFFFFGGQLPHRRVLCRRHMRHHKGVVSLPIVFVLVSDAYPQPEGTGGIVSVASVTEQMLYEIGDPSRYVLPDVVVDFTRVSIAQDGANRVRVSGARGHPPTDTYDPVVCSSGLPSQEKGLFAGTRCLSPAGTAT